MNRSYTKLSKIFQLFSLIISSRFQLEAGNSLLAPLLLFKEGRTY